MEQKHFLMSALSVELGVELDKWTGGANPSSNAITPRIMEQEMLNLIVDGRESKVTFDEFPYYLREQTRVLLTRAAFVYLKNFDFSKHTRNLAPASRTILLLGPTEFYQQLLAKALAHYFESRLLLLDITDFSLKIQGKYGAANKEYSLKRSISETNLGRMSGLFGSISAFQPREESEGTLRRQSSGVDIRSRGIKGIPPTLRRNASASANLNNLMSNKTPSNPGFY